MIILLVATAAAAAAAAAAGERYSQRCTAHMVMVL